MTQIILPALGDGIEKATVACWHVKPGDAVQPDDDIVELVTDKAVFHVPAGSAGVVKEIFFKAGEDAPVGATLALITQEDRD